MRRCAPHPPQRRSAGARLLNLDVRAPNAAALVEKELLVVERRQPVGNVSIGQREAIVIKLHGQAIVGIAIALPSGLRILRLGARRPAWIDG